MESGNWWLPLGWWQPLADDWQTAMFAGARWSLLSVRFSVGFDQAGLPGIGRVKLWEPWSRVVSAQMQVRIAQIGIRQLTDECGALICISLAREIELVEGSRAWVVRGAERQL